MAVTRNDVARRAGVSAATVSYVLNNGPRGVSPERRRRVLAAVAELEYRPNAIARSLRARRTRILGLVLPDSANPYFASLSHAIEEAAAARDYQVVVANAADRPEREAVQLESLLRLQVDGLVWIPADLRGAPPPAWRPETPMVQVDRALLRDGPPVCDTIASDHVSGGTLAAEHLLGLGHVRVAYLAGPVDHVHARERLRGFTETLRTRGLSPEPVAHGDFKYASGAAIAADWCRLPADRRPTAIACGNDAMALGVLSALAHAGLRVPGDVSVTGYDDLPQARYAVPPLSTVAQPLEEIAAAAVERLLLRVESPGGAAEAISIVLPVRFICRESTAPPPEVTPAPIAATPSTAPVATPQTLALHPLDRVRGYALGSRAVAPSATGRVAFGRSNANRMATVDLRTSPPDTPLPLLAAAAAPVTAAPPPAATAPAGGPRLFSAQLSELEFNRRVLGEALDRQHPLLERLKLLAITHDRLDEFFEIHVSGLRAMREGVQVGTAGLLPEGRTATEALAAVESRVRTLVNEQEAGWRDLQRELRDHGIYLLSMEELDDEQQAAARTYFEHEVFPVLTPLAVDPAHPFPHISHLSLSLAVILHDPDAGQRFARLKVPPNLPRLVPLPPPGEPPAAEKPNGAHTPVYFVWLESLIAAHLGHLFPGVPVTGSYAFRVTRDYDQDIPERDAQDLLSTVQQSLRERFFGFVVRLEYSAAMPESARARLVEELEVAPAFCYASASNLGLRDLLALDSLDRPDLKYAFFKPRVPTALTAGEDIFATLRRRDVLLHHPFDSFAPVVQLIEAAAADPDVLAIKQTLYRVGPNSPIVDALVRARQNDKQVAVLVELKARGDEENNIEWAQALERVGIHVVYGIIGLKTHCKATLVVRREADGIKRYVHVGTGNYNASTARQYTDIGLLSCRPELGADLTDLFNLLTGYSRQDRFHTLLVAPTTLRRRLVELINREIALQANGEQGHVIIKVNGLTDVRMIETLYRASQAGVKIELIVRGMCSLRPGAPGMSENIRVVSIVGRFLEHSRLYYFRNGGHDEIYAGSADLMPRNLDRRVETLFPVLDEAWRDYLRDEVLRLYLSDTAHAHELQSDGTYLRLTPAPGADMVDAQGALLAAARSA